MQGTDYGAASLPLSGPKVPGRWRLNWMSMIEAALVPWAVFVCVNWLLSSSIHYEHTVMVLFLVAACLLVPAGLWFRVFLQQRKNEDDIAHREPNWFTFLAVTASIAWVLGVAFGMYNWTSFVQPYYDTAELAMLQNVSTRDSNAGQYIDIGAVEFAKNTDVIESMAMAYKDGNLYCVAPIVTRVPNASAPATYDFWAVGVNCCNPFEPRVFTCGEPTTEESAGGMRLLDSSLVPYYRKAVQMAGEQFSIMTGKTLFLTWTPDPIKKVKQLQIDGKANFDYECELYLFLSIGLMLVEAAHQKYLKKKMTM